MADFSSEWRRVRNLGEQVHSTELSIQRVRAEISSAEVAVTNAQIRLSQAQSRLNSIPSYYGNDDGQRAMYEQMRADAQMAVSDASYQLHEAESRLNYLHNVESGLNAQLLTQRTEASQVASEYKEARNKSRAKIAPANIAASKFEQISGLRFGKNAAIAGSELSNQRALHYQSEAMAYDELTEAASMAKMGIIPQKSTSSVAERGTFNPVSIPTATEVRTFALNTTGIVGVTAINNAALTALTSNNCSASHLSPTRFSAASVPCSAENSLTLNSMTNKLGMNKEDFNSFIKENGLCLVTDEKSNTAELITLSAVKASPEKINILAQPAPAKSGEFTKKKIDGHTYYYDANNEIYRVDNMLVENSSYELNGYKFKTDEVGRVASVEGKLHFRKDTRKNIRDTKEKIGKGYEQPFDERGHLIADWFEGPNGLENIIMQNAHLNHSEYKKFENQLADFLDKEYDVRVRILPVYEESSFRPTKIVYDCWIDGERFSKAFDNPIEVEKGKSQ